MGAVTVLVIDRDGFQRLCGNLFEILRRNMSAYSTMELPEEEVAAPEPVKAEAEATEEAEGGDDAAEDEKAAAAAAKRGKRRTNVFVEAVVLEDDWVSQGLEAWGMEIGGWVIRRGCCSRGRLVAVPGVAAAGCAEVAWKACRQELGLGLGFSGFLFIAFLCVLLFGVASQRFWIGLIARPVCRGSLRQENAAWHGPVPGGDLAGRSDQVST